MRNLSKRIVTLAVVILMMISVIPVQAFAASSINVPSTYTMTAYASQDKNFTGTGKIAKEALVYVPGKITNLKSTNTKVVSASKSKSGDGYNIVLTAKKKGTSTVSFKYKGKKYSTKVTVMKYTNPVSSVKIGGTTIKGSKFNSSANYTLKYSKYKNKSVKVTVKLASGWKLGFTENKYSYWRKGWAKTDEKANGKKVTVKGGKGFSIILPATNTKTGQEEMISIFFK